MNHEIGEHHLVEFTGCQPDRLKYVSSVESVLTEAADRAGAITVGHLSHQFEPCGVTCMILITESHFSLHTWPEKGYAAMDIFTCGHLNCDAAIGHVASGLKAKDYHTRTIPRGAYTTSA